MEVVQIVLSDLAKTSKVTCPYCAKSKFIPNVQLRALSHALRAKCTCDHIFEIMVNRRGFPRKVVRFKGELFFQGALERLVQEVVSGSPAGSTGSGMAAQSRRRRAR